jgi:hypothetical protein
VQARFEDVVFQEIHVPYSLKPRHLLLYQTKV